MGRIKNLQPSPVIEKPKRGKIVLRPITTDAKFVNEKGVMYEQKEFFTFKSRIAGTNLYPGDDGTAKQKEGFSVRDDITPREREYLVTSGVYKDGYMVELNVSGDVNDLSINALNDQQITNICKTFLEKKDKQIVLDYIEKMTSEITLGALKDEMIKLELPAYLTKYVDGRIEELNEKYMKEMEAPIPDIERDIKKG